MPKFKLIYFNNLKRYLYFSDDKYCHQSTKFISVLINFQNNLKWLDVHET